MLEAEIKFEIIDFKRMCDALLPISTSSDISIYLDQYFDHQDHSISHLDRELRIREVRAEDRSLKKALLTHKSPPVSEKDKNKEEIETLVDDPQALGLILHSLGFISTVKLEKRCHSFNVLFCDKEINCTVVELSGTDRFFLEIEIESDYVHFSEDKGTLENFARQLGLTDNERTEEYYTDIAIKFAES